MGNWGAGLMLRLVFQEYESGCWNEEARSMDRRSFLVNGMFSACALRTSACFGAQAGAPVVVRTRSGALRGEIVDGMRVFKGVPFAQAPVGELRFLPAQKVAPWTGERDATRFAAAPMQPEATEVAHSEDCLYLNVWAPEGKGPFPVFVWVHGGGFTGGYSYQGMFADGAAFAREGIVCVTVAYRLGVFGFMDCEPLLGAKYAGSANNALSDLMEALRWVQENIAAFGGDPGRVTLGGESAGAKLTDILMGVPEAKPLFQQMISESGGAERVWSRAVTAGISKGFMESWAAQAGGGRGALQTAEGADLIRAQKAFIDTWPQHFPLRAEIDGRLVPRLPVETIAAGSSKGKRLLIGTNREESALFIGPHPAHDPSAAQLGNMSVARFDPVYAKYVGLYPEMSVEERRIRAVTAEEYWVPSLRVAEAHVKGGGNAYVYELDFGETSGRLKGYSYHTLELGLVWNAPHGDVGNALAEAALGKRVHAAWCGFIRGEPPAAEGLPVWPEYDLRRRGTMVFGMGDGAESRVVDGVQGAELRVWDGVM